MRFDIVTIFPEFFDGPLDYGILRRARATGLVEVRVEDLREYTHDRHRTVDDRPFGGGEGMVLKPEPVFEAVEAIAGAGPEKDLGATPGTVTGTSINTAIVLLSASGRMFNEQMARRLSKLERVVLICGRYEGVDERVAEHLATEEISIGDFVLSGGELPAAVIVDTVTRLLPGALGNEASAVHESFSTEGEATTEGRSAVAKEIADGESGAAPEWLAAIARNGAGNRNSARGGILDCPHYTRPADFRDWPIPEVLMGGNHEQIRIWRRRAALAKTLRNRPDLLAHAALTREEFQWLEELHAQTRK
jgi:tRNA (guanine37-N1)-methyltransferase